MSKYRNEAAKANYIAAKDLYEMGFISAKDMQRFDEDCLIHEASAVSTSKAVISSSVPAYALSPKAPN
jgi:DNA-binding transcriptional regulator YiaG